MTKTIIKNVNIITMNSSRDIIEGGFVVIDDDKIAYIGTNEQLHEHEGSGDCVNLDGKNGILMPGMVNTHCHVPMVAFRSLGDDVPDRLKRYLFPLEMMLVDEELTYKGTKYGVAEMLLGGVTTYCDCYYFEDEVAKASKEMGIRGVLSETIVDFKAPNTTEPYGGIKYSESFFKKWINDELITPAITCHALYTNDSEHLKIAHELAGKYSVPMIMHVAEMDYEQKKCRDEFGMTPVEYLDSLGILDDNFIGVHLVNVDDRDIDILEKRGVGISHNVGSNAKGAKGVAPANEMYKRGLKLGLGTDGPMSGNTLDILTQMPLVAKIHISITWTELFSQL
jgi:cytosine/adenosine deaminase-related metal-dependent hydrolase